jgi:hypothetical protein
MKLREHSPETLHLKKCLGRRGFLKASLAALCLPWLRPLFGFEKAAAAPVNSLFWIKGIPDQPFSGGGATNYHAGIENLVQLMGDHDLKFYRSAQLTDSSGPSGMIEANDVVLIKVNAQWKYRGCTNSDLIRGLIQRILDHPDGFNGEVVVFENGQGRGSLGCDTTGGGYSDAGVHANANDEGHSFVYLVDTIFRDPRVSFFLLDPIRSTFIGDNDHATQGYRRYENVSYPCFTTTGGHRVELREGLWQGSGYGQNLKLINVPVLKHHDTGGSEITASLKHLYGVLSMADGQSPFRHYGGLGETCGKMMVSVRTPVLNIIDAIWVSHSSLAGYPGNTTVRLNQVLASQDPVALDYWAAKYILYPIDNNSRHHPAFSGIDQWLTGARDTINGRGGLSNPAAGITVSQVTKNEAEMAALIRNVSVRRYGPGDLMTREQMAVYVITAMQETPSAANHDAYFDDIADDGLAPFINRMSEMGMTSGTGARAYGPKSSVTRKQMAVFIVTSTGQTPSSVPHDNYFDDVADDGFAPFINRMFEMGWTSGIRLREYGPDIATTRAQMSVFIVTAMGQAPSAVPYNAYFNDIADDGFAPFINRMFELGITAGY